MTDSKRTKLYWLGGIALALLLFSAWVWRGNPSDHSTEETSGKDPLLVEPDSEKIPSVGVAKTIGWAKGEAPVAAKGLTVARFAEGLDHPRTILTLPNGDVLVSETGGPQGNGPGGITGFVQGILMSVVGAGDASPNRLILLRDADGNGSAEARFTLREAGLDSPSGLAWRDDTLYIANHNAVLAFAYTLGETALKAEPKKLMDLPAAGNHWMRNLLLSEDGKNLYVAVGSASNIGERGMTEEMGRAAIWEIDLVSGGRRQFAAGLRNPNGMAWNPSSGELWTVVNERDMLGPDLVPDYLTNVPIGAQYGWPWLYWKDKPDWRVKEPMPDYLTEYARKPEYALGAHTAPLGLQFSGGGNLMGANYANGAFIARHGSWNRKPLAGYDVVFVGFDDHGNPQGKPQMLLSGFLTGKGNDAHGRPVWLAFDKGGALLVSDDTGGVIWRVLAPGTALSARPAKIQAGSMPPRRSLEGNTQATIRNDPPEGQ